MSTYKPDCRKFQANIFNKSKCTNCFRQREEHSTDALDSNRASRSVSKCGYLFVAPDWDFTIPLYRTKRWQRRWFVLYDDGELTYSVDDLPATIPQGVIDMNRVLEVSSAEDVTGNQFSLAITSPDRVTFVKGTTREESRWWQDVLSVFPRMHKHGRHKRNATFPGIKGSSGAASASTGHQSARPGAPNRAPNTMESPVNQRVRFHSISSDLRGTRRPCSAPSLDTQQFAHQKQFSGGSRSSQQYDSVTESSNGSDISNEDDDGLPQTRRGEDSGAYSDEIEKNNQKNSYYSSKTKQIASTPTSFSNDTSRNEYGGSNTAASGSTVTPYNSLLYSRSNPIPTPSQSPSSRAGLPSTPNSTGLLASIPSRLLRDDHKENTPPFAPEYDDNPPTSESPPTQDKQTHRLRTRRALNREARALSQPRSELDTSSVLADLEATKREEKLKDIAASITTTSSRRRQYHHLHHQQSNVADKPTRDRDTDDMDSISDPTDTPPPTQVRGAPDGCGGADDGGSVSLPRVDLPAEDLLFIKKGWLFKAADNQEWNKHWFVLQGTGLRFYRNSSAEETGILDGIIDLGTAEDIHNLDVARNYGFVIKTWSEKQFVFSAVTAGIRSNWVTALRNAAGLKEAKSDLSPGKEANGSKDSLSKTATIESVAAERDSSSQSKSLLANNKKNASMLSKSSSSNLDLFSTPNGVSKTSFSANDTGGFKLQDGVKPDEVTENRSSSRVALSSDDEYKTASETSAASNLSNDNADFFDWDGSRLPNSISSSPIKKPRSQSSPPNSRRGTSDSFPSSESSLGLSKNLLDKYKNMQNLTTKHSTPIPSKTSSDELESQRVVSDHRNASHTSLHDTCDPKSTCAKLSSYSTAAKDGGISALKLSDSLRSLDLEGSIHHEKVSSSGTLASGSGDALLVDLLETQVETLKAKLEATQADLLELHKEHVALHQRVTQSPDTRGRHFQQQNASPVSRENLPSANQEPEHMNSNLIIAEDTLGDTLEQRSAVQNLNHTYRKKLEALERENVTLRKNLEDANEESAKCRKHVEEHCSTILQLQTCVEESDSLLGQYKLKIEEKDDDLETLHAELRETQDEFLRRQAQMQDIESKLSGENESLKEQLDVSRQMLQELQQKNMELNEAKMNAEEENSCARQELEDALSRARNLQEEVEELVEQVDAKDELLAEQAAALRDLRAQHEQEKATWREAAEGGEAERCAVGQMQSSLEESEKSVAALRARLDDSDVTDGLRGDKEVSVMQAENASLITQLRECHDEIARLRESVKCEKSEAYKWKDLVKELRSLLDGRNIDMDRKREEIRLARESLKSAQQDHDLTRDKLQRGIEENEALTTKVRELQRQLNSQSKRTSSVPSVYASRDKLSSRRQLPRFDSLSDLSNVDFSLDPDTLDRETLNDEYCDVRSRLELSLNEIRALRRELRESQSEHDALQLKHLQLTQDCARQRHDSEAQLAFMTERVQDLANKLTHSEKQVRQMKTKMTRAESRDRRRTQSLRGKDSLGVGKDIELKLSQLEARIDQLMPTIDMTADGTHSSIPSVDDSRLSESQRSSVSSKHGGRTTKRSKSFDDPSKSSRLRRKSLDSSAAAGDGVQAALRISSLEAKVAALTPARSASPARTGSPADSPSSSRSKTRSSGERYSRSRRAADSDSKLATEAPPDVMSSISLQLGECVEWLDAYSCSCGRSELSFLHKRLTSLYQLTASGLPLPPSPYSLSQPSQKLLPTVQQVALLLQQKLASLNEKRHNLKNSNSWTKEAQLKNFAERIAYETVLLGQLSQALRICSQSNCNIESVKLQDLMESHRKMAFLEKKLTNPEFDLDTMAPLEFYTSMLAEKLVVTGEVLASVNRQESQQKPNGTLTATCRDLQVRLLERECQLARLISNYKEEKLHEIAVVMAQESRKSSTVDESVLLEEVRIREAWNSAHDLLIQEIMSHQTSQSLLRMTHMLNLTDSSPTLPSASSLSLTLCSAEATDRLQAAAEESLKQEMEESVLTLSQKHEEILAQQRAGDTSLINSVSASIEEVLSEFAGVMAQKALIDGHLALLQEEFDKSSIPTAHNSLMISEDNKDPMESAVDILDSEAHLLMFLGGKDSSVESLVKPALSHAEFTFLYNKGVYQSNEDSKQLLQQILSQKTQGLAPASSSSFRSSSLSLHQTSPVASDRDQDGIEQPRLRSAISMSKISPSPKSRRRHESRKSRRSSDITGMTSPGCKMCEEMRSELNKLQKKLQQQSSEDSKCTNCPKLLDTIERLETAQRARAEQATPSDSNQTLAEMENRIMVLEAAYEAKITALELQYKQALASHPDCGDDTIRQKYQKEIEELRGLCEKGLGTMEISTQRIVAEIKEKHRQELSLLQAEKEQALAEETQATLAALDAMRKAHEAEVQREVAKMKEEFILKMQSGQDLGELSQRHEAEMRDIRREILSLSEKYSVKCLESADLETKIDNLTKQLSDATQSIADLEARNNKLKSQLSEKISSLKAGATAGDAESDLKLCIAETILKDDKIAKMGAELQQIQAHEGEVMEVCRHLRHFLRSDRPTLASDQLSSVTDRLEHLMMTAPKLLRDHSEGGQQQRQARPALRRPKVYSSKELTRSPSCPRLGAHPPRLSCVSAATDDFLHCFPLPNSPLSGMVASRKKVFENCDGCSNSSKA